MSCPLEKFARVVGKCPVCLAEHEAGPSSLPGLIADWAEDDRPAPPDGVVSLPAPKPDELTVDDVLAFATSYIGDDEVMLARGHTVRGDGDGFTLVDGEGQQVARGTLGEVLAFAKGWGLLG